MTGRVDFFIHYREDARIITLLTCNMWGLTEELTILDYVWEYSRMVPAIIPTGSNFYPLCGEVVKEVENKKWIVDVGQINAERCYKLTLAGAWKLNAFKTKHIIELNEKVPIITSTLFSESYLKACMFALKEHFPNQNTVQVNL